MTAIRSIGLIANPHKSSARALADRLIDRARRHGATLWLDPDTVGLFPEGAPCPVAQSPADLTRCDLVVVMGGDGTLLRAMRYLAGSSVPILGVNVGSLGFLSEAAGPEMPAILDEVLEGKGRIVRRPLLQAEVLSPDGTAVSTLQAMNDVVIDEGSTTRRAVRLRMTLSGQEVGTFMADGIIIATPAGSTAYSLSAGGPVLEPTLQALVATPICPHTLSVRPLVYPVTEVLTVEDLRQGLRVNITADGQVTEPVPPGGRVRVSVDPGRAAHFVTVDRRHFYEVLRAKLRWGVADKQR